MTEYITPTTWEQCAAHVEAGGVVEIEDAPGVWINDRAAATTYRGRCGTPDDGWAPRRLVPGESAPAPESSTGIGEGEAVRAYYRPTAERLRAISEVMTAERLRDEAAAPAAGDDLRERIAQAIWERDGWGDPWVTAGHLTHTKYRRMADAVLAVLPPQPTPPPALPWPGAVLSGLVDEDGVPTWLAQAGQVRGEQVRSWHGSGWVAATHSRYAWVEVRAPRAVPEPETERVPWYRAMGRTLPYGELLGDIVQAYPSADSPGGIYVEYELPERNTTGNPHRDDADGTVEVLKDGES